MLKICLNCMNRFDSEFTVCPHCGFYEGVPAADTTLMPPGVRLRERYTLGGAIGKGGFGVTYSGWDNLIDRPVAIREYLPSEFSTRAPGQTKVTVFSGDKREQFEDGRSKFIDESKRLAKFTDMEGIVNVYDSFEENGTAYIIMELLRGETLAERLKREGTIPPEVAIAILAPIIRSLEIVHENGILHRDISPDNIFLTKNGGAKLIDFGAARFATTKYSRSLTVIIKPGYSPEEQYRSRGDHGPHTDVYSVGATLYRMITGCTPPDAMERRAFFEGKGKDVLKTISSFNVEIDPNLENAILNALNVRIEDRTPDMAAFTRELTADAKVERRRGGIKITDLYRWPNWAKIGASVAAALVLTMIALFAFGMIGFNSGLQTDIEIPEGMSRVPSVINNELEAAESRLTEVGLLCSVVGKEFSETVPANMILTQDISAGSVVARNTVVRVFISGGVETAIVPDITGLNVDEAVQILEDLGFTVQIEVEYNPVSVSGAVISQSSKSGDELKLGAAIKIVVSGGLDPDEKFEERITNVPDFIGMTYQNALEAARDAGVMLSVTSREFSDAVEKDAILSQSIPAGSEIMSGVTVELVVSLGERAAIVTDFVFRREEEVRSELQEQGLVVDVTYEMSETVAKGLVISQDPAPGKTLRPNDVVSIVVSGGGESFPMPDVVGLSEAEARFMLSSAGLSVIVDYEKNGTVPVGAVISQSAAANTPVNRGDSVSITIRSSQTLINVPNVVGQTESSAQNALTSLGFNVSVFRTYSRTVAKDRVISQSPEAGASHARNTTVVLTVSEGGEPVKVPDVAGMTRASAESALRNLGFSVIANETFSSSVPKGSVISQSPPAGSILDRGSTVAVTISLGTENSSKTPTGLRLNTSNLILTVDGTAQITATIEPADADDKTLKWTSSNPSVATVSSIGFVTAMSSGITTITATTNTGGFSASLTVTVNPDARITAVDVTPDALSLIIDQTGTMIARVSAEGVIDKSVNWSSGDTKVATVSGNGVVTARAEGSVTITATSKADNTKRGTSIVTVKAGAGNGTETETGTGTGTDTETVPVNRVSVSPSSLKINISESRTLTVSVLPSNASNKSVTWSSDNISVVTVSSGGVISAKAVGKATVTATSRTDKTKYGTCTIEVVSTGGGATGAITSVVVSPGSITLSIDSTRSLAVTVNPSNAKDKSVTWSSSDTRIATVSGSGVVTARATGSARITATSNSDRSKSDYCTVTVTNVYPTAVTVSPNRLTLYRNEVFTLIADVLPSNATNKNVTWSSSNTGVASVSSSGHVTARSAGTATITATSSADSSRRGSCTVTVIASDEVSQVSITQGNITLEINESRTLTAVVSPSGVSDKSVRWETDKSSIATVSGNGVVTAVGAGIARITAISNADSSKSAVITVTVNPAIEVDVEISPKTIPDLALSENFALSATVTPTSLSDRTVTWSTGNNSVAAVSAAGVVTAVGAGTTQITATSNADGSKHDSVTVTVIEPAPIIPVDGVTVSPGSVTLAINTARDLTVEVSPSTATDKTVTWTSSNSDAATVSASGAVTAKAPGTTTITATSNSDGSKNSSCTVTVVTEIIDSVTVSPTTLTLRVGEYGALTAAVLPESVVNKAVVWMSSNTGVATVSSEGVVTAVGIGETTITARSSVDGSKLSICVVSVVS
ncbi:MAG: Ig-like domain-containing protein [Oscillospiraceae bacterium]|nr:Ig-like domain-containing protein [Oscillospiraceae bacterium]